MVMFDGAVEPVGMDERVRTMDTHTKGIGQVVGGKRQRAALSISETVWGYTISRGGSARTRANMGELAAIAGCLFFGAASFGQWLLPDAALGAQVLPFKISSTIMFFVFSALLYLIARRGLTVEAQVDIKRQKLSLVRRNGEGATTQLAKYGFAEIGSVYIKRSKSEIAADQMFVRPKSGVAPILIVSGPARELEPLLDRIQTDFRGQMATAPKARSHPDAAATPVRKRSAFATG